MPAYGSVQPSAQMARTPLTTIPMQPQQPFGGYAQPGGYANMYSNQAASSSSYHNPWGARPNARLAKAQRSDISSGPVMSRARQIENALALRAPVHLNNLSKLSQLRPANEVPAGILLGSPIDSGATCFITDPSDTKVVSEIHEVDPIDVSAFGGDVTITQTAWVEHPSLSDRFPSLLLPGGQGAASLGTMIEDRRCIQLWHPDYGFHLWKPDGEEVPSVVYNKAPHLLERDPNVVARLAFSDIPDHERHDTVLEMLLQLPVEEQCSLAEEYFR